MTTASMFAQRLLDEGATSLTEASPELKSDLTLAYLWQKKWDVEVTFNMREFRDAEKAGKAHSDVVMEEIYVWAEIEYGHAVAYELAALREDSARDVDSAITQLKTWSAA